MENLPVFSGIFSPNFYIPFRSPIRPKGGGREAAVSIAIRLRRIDGFCLRQNPRPKTGKDAGFWPAQGIDAD
jgi:hypothetical protein